MVRTWSLVIGCWLYAMCVWSQCRVDEIIASLQTDHSWPAVCNRVSASYDEQRDLIDALRRSTAIHAEKIGALRSLEQKVQLDTGAKAYVHRYIGNSQYALSSYTEAAMSFDSAHHLAAGLPKEDSTFFNITLANAGIMYSMAGDLSRAKNRIRDALENGRPLSPKTRANCIATLADIAKKEGNLGLAIEYFDAAGQLYLSQKADSIIYIERCLNPKAIGYSEFAQYRQAYNLTQKALGILSRRTDHKAYHGSFISLENNRAAYAIELFEFDEAQAILEGLLKKYSTAQLRDYLNLIHINLANCYQVDGAFHRADSILQLLPEGARASTQTRRHIASHKFQYYRKTNQFDLAKSIVDTLVWEETGYTMNQLTDVMDALPPAALIGLVNHYSELAFLYADQYEHNAHEAYIDSAWQCVTRANDAIERLRIQLVDPTFTQDLTALSDGLMAETVLYVLDKKPSEFARLYPFIEKARATSLLYAMKRSALVEVPENLQQINAEIKNIEDALYALETNEKKPDKNLQINTLRQQRVNAIRKKNQAIQQTSLLQSVIEPPSIEEIQQQLHDQAAVVYYFLANETINIFKITKNTVDFIQRPMYNEFVQDLQKVAITDFQKKPSKENWIAAVNRLSDVLVRDVFSASIQELIIIPSGQFISFPFESLMTARVDTDASYRSMPYLIKKASISYNFSASILMEMQNKKTDGRGFLLMAPTFESIEDGKSTLLPLPHAQKEVDQIRATWKNQSTVVTSKQPFTKKASAYKLIHFAGHAYLDASDASRSYLAFSGRQDPDDRLRMDEIYDLNLTSDMVVLSACNTGTGTVKKGEGVLSLTRAFASAGSKSLLYSLWPVDDRSTAELMKNFYRHVSDGLTKDAALRQAKLDYLDSSFDELCHPYFWAGFVAMGDMGVIKTARPLYPWAIMGFLLLGGCYFYYRNRSRLKR